MTKTWKLEDAKAHLSQLIRDAEHETQIITRHGRAVARVTALPDQFSLEQPRNALSALRGDFDFSDLPDEDWLDRDRRSDLRDLDL
jgi:prevent-host-death family protein